MSPLVSLVLAASPCGDCDSGEKLRLKDQVGSVNLSALIGPSAIIMSSVRFTYISLSDFHMFVCVCVCARVCDGILLSHEKSTNMQGVCLYVCVYK